ncbi:MAG: DUF4358 domain-containing protein [Firmicutes bacterium]|nr:DUF4358 domain-containing protein [Clostridiales bacterium]MBQ4339749.1 DUF4358 domain-containing protein [Bacillota bacterium]
MKKALIGILVMMMIFATTGCGNGEEAPPAADSNEIYSQDLAKHIRENVTFKDHMDIVDNDILFEVYGIDPGFVIDASSYFSTGATAEEITVIKTDDIEAVMTAYEDRIESQIEGFENYVPEELTKLAVPYKLAVDNTVILVICDDPEEAEVAVKSYIDDLNNN